MFFLLPITFSSSSSFPPRGPGVEKLPQPIISAQNCNIVQIKPPAKRQKSIALAKSESMVPNMQNLISRPMGTLFLVSDAPQTSISRKTDLSSIIEVFPEFQLCQKGGKIQNPLCRPPHFFAMLGVRTNPRPLLLYKWGAFL